LNVH
jgi:hypothetical protein